MKTESSALEAVQFSSVQLFSHVHQVGDAIQPSHPLSTFLLLPSIFPSIRVFYNVLVLHIR